MPKLSKQVCFFEQICKEIQLYKDKCESCSDSQQAKIKLLKNNVKEAETSLINSFGKLSVNESEDYLDMYLQHKGITLDLLIDLEEKTQVVSNSEGISESSASPNFKGSFVKLPKFNLNCFYGESENWISFKELFVSTIMNNEQLSKIEKLQYLHSSVRGNAAKLIRGFPLREENLDNCWELLCERYENKRQLALSQINKIFSLKVGKANSSKTLLEMLDTCNEAIRNLKTIGLESNALSELMLINFMVGKLEESIKQRWELTMDNDSIPDLDSFKKFVEREARSLEDVKNNKSESKFNSTKKLFDGNNVKKQSLANSAIVKKGNGCILCQQMHSLFKCPSFNSKSVIERWEIVKTHNLCQNCLRGNHRVESCRINFGCKNCSEKHHTALHIYSNNRNSGINNVASGSSVSNSAHSISSNVLLSTALIKVQNSTGMFIQCRALIDNASQNSLITKECAKRLNLPLHSTSHSLIGINCLVAETSLSQTEFTYTSHFSGERLSANAFVVDKITSPLPNFQLRSHDWPHTRHLVLADPLFYECGAIDILLGAEQVCRLLNGCPVIGMPGTPTAFPSRLGHLLSGNIDLPTHNSTESSKIFSHATIIAPSKKEHDDNIISQTLKTFFEIEAIPETDKPNVTNTSEEIFSNSVSRNQEGRYTVKLPFKEDKTLGDSKTGALSRFFTLENKLSKNPALNSEYSKFMNEYMLLNHMTEITSQEIDANPNYYMPHHAVLNENSSTTKLRVVFDASFKSNNNCSLNDVLYIGPKLQSNIFDNLLKFRSYPIGFTADIEKMYRQILIAEEDRNYQRIFWRDSPSDPLKIYKLNTITYGTSCAPYLAIRTLKQLCQDEKTNYPLASHIAGEHFYMDDLLAGAESIDSAKIAINQLRKLLMAGGLPLRKWASSHPDALAEIPEKDKAKNTTHFFDEELTQRVLGIFWQLNKDTIQIRAVSVDEVQTKRELLSIIAKIYDPLGLLAPATIILKLLLQELWKLSLTWDEKIPSTVQETWNKFHAEIDNFKEICVPRYLGLNIPYTKIELHGFCDASTKAYAAVAYLKIISHVENSVSLVASKTRIAPVKELTLPRLELCGACLLVELITAIKQSVKLKIDETFLWCDSTIVLSWIANPPAKGNQFVTHRVSKLLKFTTLASWRHISGKLNPADCATRGLYPKALKTKSDWWNGPQWLYTSSSSPSAINLAIKEPPSQELGSEELPISSFIDHFDLLTRFSSYSKLVRVLAWIKRFIYNTQSASKTKGPLTAEEISSSTKAVIKLVQHSEFGKEITLLQNRKSLPKSNKLLSLNVFLDSEDILRVGGRLSKNKTLSFDARHQMLLPKHHPVTAAIIRYFHLLCLHGGPDLVLSLIRQSFWIIDGRSTVKREIKTCMVCARYQAKPISQIMGDLPAARVNPNRPFLHVGVDYAGPISTKCQHKRKASVFKSYICIFICMCTKAVHMELVTDLSTEAFLNSLKRFISRRGIPSDIYSDNGRNFLGASTFLKQAHNLVKTPKINSFIAEFRIKWHFIPPYGPNFGGLWESAIKIAKRHLIKTTQGSLLSFEGLSTLLCLIEAAINSRPLLPLSTNTQDFQALTPGHFLIGCPLLQLPELSFEKPQSNNCKSLSCRWTQLQNMNRSFWNRWSREYLNSLTSRQKWKTGHSTIKEGDLVLLKDQRNPPQQWSLARVQHMHPGSDGIARVLTLKTPHGTVKRLTSHVASLPDYHAAPARMDGKDRVT